ncbi:hypothetical protein [Sporosarcina sp. A2]|uniref:hypothetical protein n=1 Tax=Sporosarcina sp. A2 TaxID=3393449 RepID=UPI003D798614
MKYVMNTYQGLKITLTEEFKPDDYLATINNDRVESVAIGNVSMMKHNIQTIVPEYEEAETPAGEKVIIYSNQHSEPIIANVVGFDASAITKKVNDRIPFIQIGDVIINRNDYSLVMPQQ